jgi:hypothetical protein
MQFLNLFIPDLRSEHYLGSEPTDRATWLNLMAFCAEQENSGRIVGCAQWKNRMWEQLCGVTKDEVSRESSLWVWEGDDLLPWNYPTEKEAIVKRKRTIGKLGGKASGKARREPNASPNGEPNASPSGWRADEGNGMEGNGMEGNGMEGKGREENGMEVSAGAVNPDELPLDDNPDGGSTSNGHTEFIRLWTECYPKHFNRQYVFVGGKDGSAVKRLLKTTGLAPDELIDVAERAWDNGGFNCNQSASISGFSSRYNQIMQELEPHKKKSNPNACTAAGKGW